MSKEAEDYYIKKDMGHPHWASNDTVLQFSKTNIIEFAQSYADQQLEKRLAEVTDEEIQKIASCLCREDSGVEAFDTLKKWILNLLKP